MADEKNVGRLNVEITGDSSNLKKAAKEGVESLKDVEQSAKSTDSSSSFSKLKGSLDAVKSMASSTASFATSAIGTMKGQILSLSSSIQSKVGTMGLLAQPFERFQSTINGMSASQLSSVLAVANNALAQTTANIAKADKEYKDAFRGGDPSQIEATKERFMVLTDEARRTKTRIALLKDAIIDVDKAKMGNIKAQIEGVGKSATRTSSKIGSGFKANTRSMLRFSGILLGMRSIYGVISRSVREYISNNDQLNATIKGASQSLGVALSPAIHAAANAFATLVKWLMTAIQYFMTFMNVVFGTKFAFGSATKGANKTAKAIGGIGKAAKAANKQLGSFDDLNVHQTTDDSGSGGGGGAAGIEPIPVEIDTSGLGTFEGYIKKLTDLILKKFKPAIDIFKSINFKPLIGAFKTLWGAVKPILTILGNTIVYLTNNIIAPFIKFFIEKLAPVALDLISGALILLTPILEATLNVAKMLWENFFGPLVTWTGGVAIAALQILADVLTVIGEWMSNNLSIIEAIVIVVGSFAAAWGLVTLAMNIASIAAGAWTAAAGIGTVITWAFGAAVAFLTSPIGIAIVAIGAIIAIGILLWKHWDELMVWFKDIWQQFTEWIGKAVDWAGAKLNAFGTWIGNIFTGIGTAISNTWKNVTTRTVDTFKKIASVVGDTVNKVLDFLGPIGSFWKGIVDGMLVSITETVAGIKRVFKGITDFVSGVFSGDWTKAWNGIKEIFKGVVDSLAAIFKTPINIIIGGLNGFLGGLNKIKIPDWVPGVGGKGFSFEPISYLAKGATVKSSSGGSHTVIGEGKYDEAVIPLGQSPQFRGMKSDIASQVLEGIRELNDTDSSDQPIILELDGEELGKIIIKNINKRTMALGRTELII